MRVYWLEQSEADVPPDDGWLSAGEAVHLAGLRFAKRRADWRLGRWTAKCAVAAYFKLTRTSSLAEVEIRATASGAPEVLLAGKAAPVAISLSHRDGRALCSVAPPATALGCDLELIEPHTDQFVADYFTAEERLLVSSALPDQRELLVALIWSAKESALKALRVGLRADTREVEVSRLNAAAPHEGWQSLQVRARGGDVFEGWWQPAGKFVRTILSAARIPTPTMLFTACHPERSEGLLLPRCSPRPSS